MTVKEILDVKGAEIITVDVRTTVSELGKLLTRKNIGAALVLEGGRLTGVVGERDVVQALAARGVEILDWPVSELMRTPVVTCTPEDPVTGLMATMTQRRVRHVPVLAEGRLVGVVSIGDVVKHRLKEIEDEAQVLRDYITLAR
jgi:CBS domain-containing protein